MSTPIAQLFAKVGADTSDYSRKMSGVRSDLQDTQSAMEKFGNFSKKAFDVIAVGAVAAGAAVVGIVAKSVNAAGNLEQQAANISAIFGDMAPPIEDVKGLINSLALDPKLVVGVNEAGSTIEMLAKNGLAYTDIVDGAARSTVLLANATGADYATSADIATNAMGIFGLGVADLDNVVATFTNSANKSQFAVDDWGYVLANAGPKADAMGWSLEELFAAVTLTSSGFASGQQGGTSWAWMINGLTPSTDKAKKAMQELGLMTENGANAFFNADGTGKDLNQVMALLQSSMGGLTAEQQMSYSETLFGSEAYGALSGVLKMNLADYDALLPAMTDFAAVEKGAETRTNTYQAAMAALSDTINSVFAMIGDKFLPIFTKMSRGFAEFIKGNAQGVTDFFGKLAGVIEGAFESVSTALASFRSMFSLQLATITSDTASWGEKVSAVWYIVATSGSTLWQTLIASLTEALPSWMAGLWEWAKAAWEWIVAALPEALRALGDWAGGLWGWIVENAPGWGAALWEWAKATWQWIVDVTPIVIEKMRDLGWALFQSVNTWAATMGPTVSGLWNGLVALFIAGGQLLQGNWEGAWANLVNAFTAFGLALWPLIQEWGQAIWDWAKEVAPAWVLTIADWIVAGWDFIKSVGEVIGSILSIFKPITDAIAKFVTWQDVVIGFAIAIGIWFWPAISAAFMAVIGGIGAFVAAWAPVLLLIAVVIAAVVAMRLAWENDFLGIRTAILYAWDVITEVFGEVAAKVGWIVTTFQSKWAELTATNATLGEKLALIWNMVLTIARTVWQGVVEVVSTLLPPFIAKMQEWGAAIWEWVVKAVPIALTKIAEWSTAIINWVGAKLPDFLKMVIEWGIALYTWIGDVIPKAIDSLTDFIKGVRKTGDGDGQRSFVAMAGDWAVKLWEWITKDLIPKVGPEFMKFIKTIVTLGADLLVAVGKLAYELGLLLWEWIVEITPIAWNKLVEWGSTLWRWIATNAPTWGAKLSEWGRAAWEWIVIVTPIALAQLADWGRRLWGWIQENKGSWIANLSQWAVAIWQWIQEAFPQTTAKITEWYNLIVGWIINLRDTAKQRMDELKANVIDPVIDFVLKTKDKILEWKEWFITKYAELREEFEKRKTWFVDKIVEPVIDFVTKTKEKFLEWKNYFIDTYNQLREEFEKRKTWFNDKIVQPIIDFITTTKEKILWWKNWFIEQFVAIRDWFKPGEWLQKGRDMIQGLFDGVKEIWKSFTDWTSTTFQGWIDWFDKLFQFGSPSKLMHQRGQWLMEGLQGGINAAAQLPLNAMDSLATSVQGKVTSMVNAVKASAQTMHSTINSMPALPAGYWSTPTVPTIPTTTVPVTPVVTTPVVIPDDRSPISSASSSFGSKDLSLALTALAGVTDIGGIIDDIQAFASSAQVYLTSTGQPQLQGSSEAALALNSLQSGGVDSLSVNNLLAMIQSLIRKIDEQGFGSKFDLNLAPDASLGQQQELEQLVSYLNALYG